MKKLNLNLVRQASFRVPMSVPSGFVTERKSPTLPPKSPAPQGGESQAQLQKLELTVPLTARNIQRTKTMSDLIADGDSGVVEHVESATPTSQDHEQAIRALKIQQYKLEREIQDVAAQRNEYRRQNQQLKQHEAEMRAYLDSIKSQIENIDYKRELDNALAENVGLLKRVDQLEEQLRSKPKPEIPDVLAEGVQTVVEHEATGDQQGDQLETLKLLVQQQETELKALRELLGLAQPKTSPGFSDRGREIVAISKSKGFKQDGSLQESTRLCSQAAGSESHAAKDELLELRRENLQQKEKISQLQEDLANEKAAFEELVQMAVLPREKQRAFL